MPDEKIDQKRPVDAENEPKPIQQRHVDDTVDDSFPASDPPAWTTSASKSVAAECEPDDLNEPPTPPGEGLQGKGESGQSRADQLSGLARDLHRRSQTFLEQGRDYLPEARRIYRQGAETVSRPVQAYPLAAIVAAGALGCALGWMFGRRATDTPPVRQWHSGSNRRPAGSQEWHPTPRTGSGAEHFSAGNEAEAASHTNNSF